MAKENMRIQNLEVVHVSRLGLPKRHEPSDSWLHRIFSDFWPMYSLHYILTSIIGWTVLFIIITMSCILRCYLALAFLVIIPLTGSVVFSMYGSGPRRLLVSDSSSYNRLVLVTELLN